MVDDETLPETIPVAEAQRFDQQRFAEFLHGRIGARLNSVLQMSNGQSNPTFLIDTDQGEFVLRKQPPGKLLPSAHALDREFKALSALSVTNIPVPKAIVFCEDTSVIGTSFYLMERLKGRIFSQSPLLPGLSRQDRGAAYLAMAEALARLHLADWRQGLADFGRPDHYYERQLARWTGQWEKSKSRENPSIDRLVEWLPKHLPQVDGVNIIHGDFRLSNIMYHPQAPRVIGILDWELATIGPGIADLAHNCINYFLPEGHPNSLIGHDLDGLGIPSEARYVAHYAEVLGKPVTLAPFHRAFALFRLAVIIEGILARAKAGIASNSRAMEAGTRGIQVADQGWRLTQS